METPIGEQKGDSLSETEKKLTSNPYAAYKQRFLESKLTPTQESTKSSRLIPAAKHFSAQLAEKRMKKHETTVSSSALAIVESMPSQDLSKTPDPAGSKKKRKKKSDRSKDRPFSGFMQDPFVEEARRTIQTRHSIPTLNPWDTVPAIAPISPDREMLPHPPVPADTTLPNSPVNLHDDTISTTQPGSPVHADRISSVLPHPPVHAVSTTLPNPPVYADRISTTLPHPPVHAVSTTLPNPPVYADRISTTLPHPPVHAVSTTLPNPPVYADRISTTLSHPPVHADRISTTLRPVNDQNLMDWQKQQQVQLQQLQRQQEQQREQHQLQQHQQQLTQQNILSHILAGQEKLMECVMKDQLGAPSMVQEQIQDLLQVKVGSTSTRESPSSLSHTTRAQEDIPSGTKVGKPWKLETFLPDPRTQVLDNLALGSARQPRSHALSAGLEMPPSVHFAHLAGVPSLADVHDMQSPFKQDPASSVIEKRLDALQQSYDREGAARRSWARQQNLAQRKQGARIAELVRAVQALIRLSDELLDRAHDGAQDETVGLSRQVDAALATLQQRPPPGVATLERRLYNAGNTALRAIAESREYPSALPTMFSELKPASTPAGAPSLTPRTQPASPSEPQSARELTPPSPIVPGAPSHPPSSAPLLSPPTTSVLPSTPGSLMPPSPVALFTSRPTMESSASHAATTWSLSERARAKYALTFKRYATVGGFVEAPAMLALLLKSKVDMNTLLQLLPLCDLDQDGRFVEDEFVIAMHLVAKVRAGMPPPTSLPPEVKEILDAPSASPSPYY